jgi:hypothetical protein
MTWEQMRTKWELSLRKFPVFHFDMLNLKNKKKEKGKD